MGYGAGRFARKPAKKLHDVLEENRQNKQSEIPQEDLKERLKEIKEDILEENQSASQIEDRAEALRRMKECLITRQSMLDLSNLGLTSLLKICLHI